MPAEGNSAGAKDGYEPPPLDTEILTLVFPGEMVTAELQPSLSASGLNTNVIFSLCVMSAHILSFFLASLVTAEILLHVQCQLGILSKMPSETIFW